MNASNCPQPEFLQQFLLGQLPIEEIERCQFHLSVCDPCVETIEMLKVDDTFTGQVRAAFLEQSEPDDEKANGEYVDQLIEQAGRWSRRNNDGLEPATASQVSIDRAAEVFRLLAEPAGEREIGRLAHYSIVKLIGSGSTGVVFLASDTRLDRRVVLKILRPSLGQPAQTRFVAEAKATAAIEHPNVVTIYEVGSDGPLSYIAMQWTPGETLDQRLQNDEPLPLAEVRRLVAEVACGLAAAHASGLIHRDIKPANVWIAGKTGETKILDFGLVRVTDEDPQLTCTGMIAGTPCFMSPEQSRGDALDHRSDLFSLGCLLYQALTGRLPFHSHNALATLRSIQQDQPIAPAVLDPSIPTDVSDLTMCLLEKSPARRPPDAQSVAEALVSDQAQWKFLLPEPPTQSKPVRKRSGSFWRSIAALAAGALLGIGGYIYGQQIIRIVTNHGEIIIETDVDDVKIEVLENGEVVRVVDLATEQSFEIRAGRYEIRPAGNDDSITLDKNSLTLTRGGKVVVCVTNNTSHESVATTDPGVPYLLQPGDVLGIWIDGILGEFQGEIPIHNPAPETGLNPAVGFPIQVEFDGRIAIPFIEPLPVVGKRIDEVRAELKKAFQEGDEPILRKQARIIVNLIRKGGMKSHELVPNSNIGSPPQILPFASDQPFELPPVAFTEQRKAEESNQRVETDGMELELAQRDEMLSIAKAKFERNEISKLQLLQVESEYLNFHLDRATGLSEVKLLKRAVAVKAEQFELLSIQLNQLSGTAMESALDTEAAAENAELVDLRSQRDAIRQDLAARRRELSVAEEKQNLPPSQPIYDGQTYEQLLAIVRTERNLEKLIPAFNGLVSLASDYEKPEVLEAAMQFLRQVGRIADKVQSKAFSQIVYTLLRTLDFPAFTAMFVNELKHGNETSQGYFFRKLGGGNPFQGYSAFRSRNEVIDLPNDVTDQNLHCVKTISNALEKFTSDRDRNKVGYAVSILPGFFPIHDSARFATEPNRTEVLEWLRPIVQRYVDVVFNVSDSSAGLDTLDPWIAHYFPDAEGFRNSIDKRLNKLLQLPDAIASKGIDQTLYVIEQLPAGMYSQIEVASLANKLLAYIVALPPDKSLPREKVQQILKLLDLDENLTDEILSAVKKRQFEYSRIEQSRKIDDSSIEFFKLVDGKYVFRASGKDEPAATGDNVETIEK